MVQKTPGKETQQKKGKRGNKSKKTDVDVMVKAPKQKKHVKGDQTTTTTIVTPVVAANGSTSTANKKIDTNKDEKIAGFIFMCNARTKPECYQYRVFGLPHGKRGVVESIKEGTKLFLFDIELKLLYGVYKASSSGGMNLEPSAFNGAFPAQVRFKIQKDCIPIPESTFKQAILENYEGGRKFRTELNAQQVQNLNKLFRAVPNGQSSLAQVVPMAPPRRDVIMNPHYTAPVGLPGGRPLQPGTRPHYEPPVGPLPQQVTESRYLASLGHPPTVMEPRHVPVVAPPMQYPYDMMGSKQSYFTEISQRESAYGRYGGMQDLPPSYGMPSAEVAQQQDRLQDIYNTRVNARARLEQPPTAGYLKPGYFEPSESYAPSVSARSNAMPVSSYYSFSGGTLGYR